MATDGRRSARPVIDRLVETPYRFDFYQAVGVLERAVSLARLMETSSGLEPARAVRALDAGPGDVAPVGTDTDPKREAVRLSSSIDQSFAASDIQALSALDEDGERYAMTVNFMGLGGAHGPLPAPFSELVVERAAHHDTGPRDFLDIFNHRLTSLMVRAQRKHRFTLHQIAPGRNPFASYLFSLFGLGTTGLRGRLGVPDRALLHYTALLSAQPRSMSGLELLLGNYLSTAVRCEPMIGAWYALASDQTTVLGRTGQNRILGRGAVLGRRIWSHEWRFRLRIGPLTLAQFQGLLPGGSAFRPLCALTRFYVGLSVDFELRLVVDGKEVPGSRLGREHGTRLGWTSFLRTAPTRESSGEVQLDPRLTGSASTVPGS